MLMPNYCFNTLDITGPNTEVKKIRKYIKIKKRTKYGKDYNFFNNFHPRPKELDLFTSPARIEFGEDETLFEQRKFRHKKLYGADDRYQWNLKNRGTKWDVVNLYINGDSPGDLSITFDTAWSPPEEAIQKLSELHPEVEIRLSYDEPGMCFSGDLYFKGGEVIEAETYDDAYYGEGTDCSECKMQDHRDNMIVKNGLFYCENCIDSIE